MCGVFFLPFRCQGRLASQRALVLQLRHWATARSLVLVATHLKSKADATSEALRVAVCYRFARISGFPLILRLQSMAQLLQLVTSICADLPIVVAGTRCALCLLLGC